MKIVEKATPISDNDITNDVSQEEIVDYVDDSNISDNESSKDCLELLFVSTTELCQEGTFVSSMFMADVFMVDGMFKTKLFQLVLVHFLTFIFKGFI